ncbi:hypothetical protein [Nannocystis pusilla]|uniref:hypothetical protein n=1 Tax=Nannocystis pusilla TaxID=889268 RepID=UPI003B820F5D
MHATAPIGRWAVYVDAATGEPLAREQLLRFASGNLKINAPVRGPNGQRLDFAAANLGVVVNGAAAVTSITGAVSFADGGPANVATTVLGSFVAVASEAGAPAATQLALPPGGQVTWIASSDEFLDAQLTTYVHADRVKQFVRAIAPDFAFLDQQMPAIVNIADICNAFADGETINFFQSDAQCENTGRIADVVYHEFGHNVHFQGIIPGVGFPEGALSEGISDFLSATITDSPDLAPGFFKGSDARCASSTRRAPSGTSPRTTARSTTAGGSSAARCGTCARRCGTSSAPGPGSRRSTSCGSRRSAARSTCRACTPRSCWPTTTTAT